jgi:hypothetical protein
MYVCTSGASPDPSTFFSFSPNLNLDPLQPRSRRHFCYLDECCIHSPWLSPSIRLARRLVFAVLAETQERKVPFGQDYRKQVPIERKLEETAKKRVSRCWREEDLESTPEPIASGLLVPRNWGGGGGGTRPVISCLLLIR